MPGEPSSILERKLATILSADVAAYSRLMAEEEEHTLHVFRGHKEVFEQLVALHRGRVFNTAGDAILAEFGSAVEAVRCATEIQAALRTRNDQWPEARRVEFRIGVNLGDVMVSGADLLGDGVNVAARLQAAAEPGGICIAGSVYDQIRNKLSLSFKSLGEMNYKNIPQPVRTFAIAEADGVGPLPAPAVPDGHKGDSMRRFWILAATVLLLVGGAAVWGYSDYRRRQGEAAHAAAVSAAIPIPTPPSAAPGGRGGSAPAERFRRPDRGLWRPDLLWPKRSRPCPLFQRPGGRQEQQDLGPVARPDSWFDDVSHGRHYARGRRCDPHARTAGRRF